MAKPGSVVKLHCKDEVLEGVLMPSEGTDFIVVKLESGYNVGIKKNKVKKIEEISNRKETKSTKQTIKQKKGLPKITILHTGGTIASKVDYETGAVVAKFDPNDIIRLFPELKEIANIDSRLISNIQSEMMRFDHYNAMAKEIEKDVKKGAKGVIVTQGTDTLHFTAAALSFALEGLTVPVLIVGSQRSSDRPSADSYANLLCATVFIANAPFQGVGVCMHENSNDDTCIVIHGCKARKMHTSRRDAFRPINITPIARVNVEKRKVELLSKVKNNNSELNLKLFDPKIKVGLLKMHPHMHVEEFNAYKGFDGLVLELTGLGHAPNMEMDKFMKEHSKISKAITSLSNKMPVVTSSQCIYGRIDMNVYTPQRELLKQGVIGENHDMTPETAFIKLAWLLSNHKKDAKKLFSENLRGEISDRTEKDTYLI